MQLEAKTLNESESSRLKRWLDDPAADIYLRVLTSEAFAHEVAAVNHLMKMTTSGDSVASNDAEQADRVHFAANLFRRLQKDKTYKISTATPTPIEQ